MLRQPAVGDNAAVQTEPSKTEPPKRKHFRFQFSMRSLLIAATLLAGLCGVVKGCVAYEEWATKPRPKRDFESQFFRIVPPSKN
jgi:hypothetical protein